MYLKSKKVWLVTMLCIVICCCITALTACNNGDNNPKNTPVYTGMSISDTAPVQTQASETRAVNLNLNRESHLNQQPPFENATIEEKIKDAFDIKNNIDDIFYAKANRNAYVVVHIDNPALYEIQSFTLNGVKYASYMFEQGSDMENLILKIEIGDEYGIKEYTIDAIKYIDGTQIKDVRIGGDKTIKAGIYNEKALPVAVLKESIGIHEISLGVSVSDDFSLITDNELSVVLFDGENIVKKQILFSADKVEFNNLKAHTVYQYAVVAVYDNFDGNGMNANILYKETICTTYVAEFKDIIIGQTDIKFSMNWNESWTVKALQSLTLWQGSENVPLQINNGNDYTIDNLEMNTQYRLAAECLADGVAEKIQLEFTTLPLSSYGLEIADGEIKGIGTCIDKTLCINLPIAKEAFKGCAQIERVILGEGTDAIGVDAFADCSGLEAVIWNTADCRIKNTDDSIRLNDSDKISIFRNCQKLSSVIFGEKVARIPANAFVNCVNLETVYWNAVDCIQAGEFFSEYECSSVFIECTKLSKIEFGKNVLKIPSCAFYNCWSLTNVTIPDSVTSIGKNAFGECGNLSSIIIPDSVTYIDEYTFQGCRRLRSITIPDSVTSIGKGAFYFSGLTDITIPDSVTYIGENTFWGCSSLTSIKIPDSVTSISDNTFFSCVDLTSVTIPDSVTSIGKGAFGDCGRLTSITIPGSVTSIGKEAFWDCGIKSVYYKGTEEAWNDISMGSQYWWRFPIKLYYYSEAEPEFNEDGMGYNDNYWRYDEDGEIVVWKKEN